MKSEFVVGHTHTMRYLVPETKTVPNLLPELVEFQRGHPVLATGFMVGLLEAPCMAALFPHLDEDESYVGTKVSIEHQNATPPHVLLTVEAVCVEISGSYVEFAVAALDEEGAVAASGRVGSRVIATRKFRRSVRDKAERVTAGFAREFAAPFPQVS